MEAVSSGAWPSGSLLACWNYTTMVSGNLPLRLPTLMALAQVGQAGSGLYTEAIAGGRENHGATQRFCSLFLLPSWAVACLQAWMRLPTKLKMSFLVKLICEKSHVVKGLISQWGWR